jgi:hypothetical protein
LSKTQHKQRTIENMNKRCQIRAFKVNFLCQKSMDFFIFKNINIIFLLKIYFYNFHFRLLCFSKHVKISMSWHSLNSLNTIVSFENVDFRPKTLLYRTEHFRNSTTELILNLLTYYLISIWEDLLVAACRKWVQVFEWRLFTHFWKVYKQTG